MAGVTILQTVVVVADTTVLITILCAIVATICAIIAIISYTDFDNVKCTIVFGIISALAIAGVVIAISHPMYDKPQYQVIIEDTVSMTEFSQRYNIIEQEGITYWVTEK